VSTTPDRILYCRCAFAQAVPTTVKDGVLARLCESGVPFESIPDLCEMSARKDERLAELLSGEEPVKIVACFPRAVKWLFHQAGSPFPEGSRIEVLNMRDQTVDEICETLLPEA